MGKSISFGSLEKGVGFPGGGRGHPEVCHQAQDRTLYLTICVHHFFREGIVSVKV